MNFEEIKPYTLFPEEKEYRVLDSGENTILTCQNKSSAENYVDLLSKAYHRGYKAGYRDAKKAR